jgi:serine protease AprX
LLVAVGLVPHLDAATGKNGRSSHSESSGNSGGGSSSSGPSHTQKGAKAKPGKPNSQVKNYKLDAEVTRRKNQLIGTTSVIVTLQPGAKLPSEFRRYVRGAKLDIINGTVLELPNPVIRQLENRSEIFRVHYNRPIGKYNYRTAVTIGATTARESLGYTGRGVGVAVIDSGIASWHDDLTNRSATIYPYGNQRVAAFVDFVNGRTQPYDDNGHGTHVAGIVGGNGYDSRGEKAGVAPDAHLAVLKVLDANGVGNIGHIIAALNWVAANHQAYNIRVVNMSVGARISESYWTDPLTLATKALVDRGVVVVAAAGNFGKNARGELQYGGIAAPANAPWVLTVGASSSEGSYTRRDDTMAGFSSSGPTFIDYAAKPDLVAPGTGIVSLAAAGSTFYFNKLEYLIDGKPRLGFKPYLTLSGTSMAAPAVAGTVALMFQANPKLTPNLVKAILQYTAQDYDYNPLRQGAGFLNALGAVRLARFYAANKVGSRMPVQTIWSQQIIWGNHRITGGYINPGANAWAQQVTWGAAALNDGDNIVWGTECGDGCDNIVWGTFDADNIVWGTDDNIVWGTDDNIVWGTDDNIVWGTDDNIVWGTDDNIVWGTSNDGDNIVWGTSDDGDNIVWGTDCGGADCDNIVWGTSDDDNIVWGTADELDNIVWGTSDDGDNIVWGTSAADDVTWGSNGSDEVIYPDETLEPLPTPELEFGEIVDAAAGAAESITTVEAAVDAETEPAEALVDAGTLSAVAGGL